MKLNKGTLTFNEIKPVYLQDEKNRLIGAFIDVVNMKKSDVGILNFTGNTRSELSNDVVMGFLSNIDQYDLIITDSEILAQKEYISLLEYAQSHGVKIVFFYSTEDKRKNISRPQVVYAAHNKLISYGIDSVLCQGFSELQSWYEKEYGSQLLIENGNGKINVSNERKFFAEVTIRKIPKFTLIKKEAV